MSRARASRIITVSCVRSGTSTSASRLVATSSEPPGLAGVGDDLELRTAVQPDPGVLDVRESAFGGELLNPGGADAEDVGGLAGAAPVRVPAGGSVPLQRGGFDGLELQPAMLML